MDQRIRFLALCVIRRPSDGALLLAEGHDPVKGETFYRPLGGEVEFDESTEDAARREIREEIGAALTGLRLLTIVENRFTYRGERGHEVVALYEARLVDPSYYERDRFSADEGGYAFTVCWLPLSQFLAGHNPLYPDGLLEILRPLP